MPGPLDSRETFPVAVATADPFRTGTLLSPSMPDATLIAPAAGRRPRVAGGQLVDAHQILLAHVHERIDLAQGKDEVLMGYRARFSPSFCW